MSSSRSLLQKYNIPVGHLSYEYIDECKNIPELEKILKILRSGEEGIYPQLISHAEDQLSQLNPNSKLLRKEEPVLKPPMLDNEQWQDISTDLKDWSESAREMDENLSTEKALVLLDADDEPIRGSNDSSPDSLDAEHNNNINTQKALSNSATLSQAPERSRRPRSYADWDKFDADEELLRLETDEERNSETKDRYEKREKERENMRARSYKACNRSWFNKPTSVKRPMTKTERVEKALREKVKGNEYFKSEDYRGALRFYSNSLSINPTLAVYNNRALSFYRLNCHQDCVKDCGKALAMDPDNVKAFYRRACARHELGEDREAYEDALLALQRDPNNAEALKLAHELVAIAHASWANPESRRVSKEEADILKEEVPKWDGDYPPCLPGGSYKDLPEDIEVAPRYFMTDWGLPSRMCNCGGNPKWIRDYNEAKRACGDGCRDVAKKPCIITEIADEAGDGNEGESETQAEVMVDDIVYKNQERGEIVEAIDEGLEELSNLDVDLNEEGAADMDQGEVGNGAQEPCDIADVILNEEGAADMDQGDVGNGTQEPCDIADVILNEEGAADMDQGEAGNGTQEPCDIADVIDKELEELTVMYMDLKKEGAAYINHDDVGANDICDKTGKPIWEDVKERCIITVAAEDDEMSSKSDEIVEEETSDAEDIVKEEDHLYSKERMAEVAKCLKILVDKATERNAQIAKAHVDEITSNEQHDGSFFLLTWATFRDPDCLQHAKLLNSIKPRDLPRAIGNALDDTMLSKLLMCLDKHWTLFTPDMRLEYLEQISRLERFSFVHCFMTDKDKLAIKSILQLLHDQGVEVNHTLQAVFEL